VDSDQEKISRLRAGDVPIYEPGLESLVVQNRSAGRLAFSADLATTLRAAEVLFICVGTPPLPSGEVDLSQVESVARSIGQALEDGYKVVVNKSTVPVGSGDWVSLLIREGIEERRMGCSAITAGSPAGDLDETVMDRTLPRFDVVSNPEFLREGSAIEDMLHPDRIVAGSNSERALGVMRELYRPIIEQRPSQGEDEGDGVHVPFIETDLASAEMIKYAANAFLATKISFINEIANICERVGANIDAVSHGIGLDRRIGNLFLNAGLGWGGSCFHKDLSALTHMASDYGYSARLLTAAAQVNTAQRQLIVQRLQERLKVLKGKTVGLLGLAFKPHTDDVRDAPALTIAERLIALGVRVKGYDPVAGPNARRLIPDLVLEPTVRSLARGADALVVVTEWPEFRELDFAALRELMRTPTVVDGRNFLSGPAITRLGFDYVAIGR
jgi:UDPglucose 6-dehydrogenase